MRIDNEVASRVVLGELPANLRLPQEGTAPSRVHSFSVDAGTPAIRVDAAALLQGLRATRSQGPTAAREWATLVLGIPVLDLAPLAGEHEDLILNSLWEISAGSVDDEQFDTLEGALLPALSGPSQ